jgi:hypothetical protein
LSDLTEIIRYIQHQQEHNTRKAFIEEYPDILKEYDIDYDERFVFKSVEIKYIVPDGTSYIYRVYSLPI